MSSTRSSRRARLGVCGAALLLALLALPLLASSAAAQVAPPEATPVPAQDQPADAVPDADAGDQAPTDDEADAQTPVVPDVPDVAIDVQSEDGNLSRTVVLVLLLTVGSVAPGLLLLMTTFTRFVVVLAIAKNALGLHTVPPAQVLVGLALFLTFFVMNPVLSEVNQNAIQPMLASEISQDEALDAAYTPMREFMLAQTREQDLALFTSLSSAEPPANPDEVSAATLIPAFVISELRTAFIIGFVIFIPFLVIDLVVAAVLMSMGMMMLPPVFISLPLKVLLFVLVDGWALIAGSLVNSVNGVVV